MKKRSKLARGMLAMLLALVLVCGMLPMTAFAAEGDVAIDENNFPDENFREYVKTLDPNGDGTLTAEEISKITRIYCSNKNIWSLQGIEYFTALTDLHCYSNQLTSLNLSHNTELTDLDCGSNQLTSLDLSHNTKLTWLYCYSNQLTSLDLSHNTKLTHLYCDSNQLTSLDVSKAKDLEFLICRDNELKQLDLSNNTKLAMLYCDSNQLASLDLSQNTKLDMMSKISPQEISLPLEVEEGDVPGTYLVSLSQLSTEFGYDDFSVTDVDPANVNGVMNDGVVEYTDAKPTAVTYGYLTGSEAVEVMSVKINVQERVYSNVSFIEADGGQVTADKTSNVLAGDLVTLTITPDEGYSVDDLLVYHVNNELKEFEQVPMESENTFIMPAGDVEVYVRFKKDPQDYTITKGDGQTFTKDSGQTLEFTCGALFADFIGIEIDGEELSKELYSARSGSTVVTLSNEYLEGAEEGDHTIRFLYTENNASDEGTFTIAKASEESGEGEGDNEGTGAGEGSGTAAGGNAGAGTSGTGSTADTVISGTNGSGQSTTPNTGDNSNVALWAVLLLAACGGIGVARSRKSGSAK